MQEPQATTPLRILIVEDSEDDAFLILRELRKSGRPLHHQRVYTSMSLEVALTSEQWDLVLSDYELPGFCALDVLRQVQSHELDLPVIIVSGAIGEELAVNAMHAGAHDYIMKDNLARLNPAIERELHEMEVHRQRLAAEEALRQSEERFQQLSTNLEEVLWLIDIDAGRMVYVNPAFELIWERPSAPLLRNYDFFLETLHPEDVSRVEQHLMRDGWIGFNDEYRIQRLDGTERWISTRSFPIRDADGNVHRVAGISSDITERKRLETGMKKLSRALEQTADAVMITNRAGEIEYVNSAFEDTTGYTRDEVIGQRPDILKSGLMEPDFYRQLWQNVINGVPFTDIFINRRKNGDLFYEAKTVTPVRDDQGDVTHFVATGKDITERLRRQEHFQRMVNYDVITGLPNRDLLLERLGEALPHAERLGLMIGIFHVGLDLGGLLGELGGTRPGERLSRIVAGRLKETITHHELVAALSGEAFVVMRKFVSNLTDIESTAQELADAFTRPLVAEGYELYVTPSIGISVYPDDGDEAKSLLQKARLASRYGGQKGRSPYVFYEGTMVERMPRHLSS